jgi:hypothetical protein
MQTTHTHTRYASATLLALISSLALLAGCDRNDDRTAVGQRSDDTVASTERKGAEVSADAREAGRDVRQAAGQATDTLANTASDAAITAEIHARLARDQQLSTLSINVDTNGGNVVLRGSAPDSASRMRATELSRAVDGVASVNNELSVEPKG